MQDIETSKYLHGIDLNCSCWLKGSGRKNNRQIYLARLIPKIMPFCIWVEPTLQNGMVYVIVASMCLWKVWRWGGASGREAEEEEWEWEWEKERGKGTSVYTPTHPCHSWDVRNHGGGVDLRSMNMNLNTFAHLQF